MNLRAREVSAPSVEGQIGILAGHTPLLAVLRPGTVKVSDAQGVAVEARVTGGFISVITDLTDQKRRERLLAEQAAELARPQQALRLAERLASIGTLATGLGHDMSNMLMPIRMRLDHLEACF